MIRRVVQFWPKAYTKEGACSKYLEAHKDETGGILPDETLFHEQAGKERLVRIVAMLTKLLMRFDPEQYRVHKGAASLCATPFEHEHD